MTRPESLHLANAALEKRALGLRAHGVLTGTDLLVVDAVAARFGETNPDVLLGLAFAVRAPRVGDVGVHLCTIRQRVDDEGSETESQPPDETAEPDRETDIPANWPKDPAKWEAAVLASPMMGGPADTGLPFVRQTLDDRRTLVMTRRMWREQERLAAAAKALAASTPSLVLSDRALATGLKRLFGGGDNQGARAVATAAKRRLTVVTGGPGTGKTYSIKRLIALLVESCNDPASPLRIELAAPTGKAAVRMADAIAENLAELDVHTQVREVLSRLRPRTLHKLLGMRPDGTSRHGADRPIPADLVVVDEASMVDLAMMRRRGSCSSATETSWRASRPEPCWPISSDRFSMTLVQTVGRSEGPWCPLTPTTASRKRPRLLPLLPRSSTRETTTSSRSVAG
jgi:exodeoxyribonuclease V alpha subunit